MNIVVGIDFTPTAPLVLRRTLGLASHGGDQVTAVHVIDADTLERYFVSHPEAEKEDVIADAERRLDGLLAALPAEAAGASVNFRVLVGRPSETLAKTAEEEGADFIVLSAHDAQRKGRLGGTATRCVRRSPVDVLLTRDWHHAPFQRVVVATDFSETSEKAFARAVAIAGSDRAVLDLVHVIFPPASDYFGARGSAGAPVGDGDGARDSAEESIASFVAPFADALGDIPFTTTVLESVSASRAITGHLRETNADLAVIGTTGQGRLFGLRLGSNAERLIHDAPCSVLAVKAPDGPVYRSSEETQSQN